MPLDITGLDMQLCFYFWIIPEEESDLKGLLFLFLILKSGIYRFNYALMNI